MVITICLLYHQVELSIQLEVSIQLEEIGAMHLMANTWQKRCKGRFIPLMQVLPELRAFCSGHGLADVWKGSCGGLMLYFVHKACLNLVYGL